MSQPSTGSTRSILNLAETDPVIPDHASGTMPHSYGERLSDERTLLEFALRLCTDQTPDEALQDATQTLSVLLPHCHVAVVGLSEIDQPSSSAVPLSHSMIVTRNSPDGAGKCEWLLEDHPQSPRLVVVLHDGSAPSEGAVILTLCERLVTLLKAAFRRHRSRVQVVAKAHEAKQLLARVVQTEKLAGYGQVIAGVLHDLNNPLAAILAYAEYLSRTLPAQQVSGSDLERLSRIREAAERALCHTRSLVEYARPADTQLVEVDLAKLIQNALVFCEHEIARAKIQASLLFDGLNRPVLGIPGQLTQLFVNLFTNAAHAAHSTHAELRVECGIDGEGQFAQVRVLDNGIGILAADLEHVFDPFFTTKNEGRGFGLGLAIVRDIVVHHGGRIQVDSEPNVGTSFNLWLPLAPPSSANSS